MAAIGSPAPHGVGALNRTANLTLLMLANGTNSTNFALEDDEDRVDPAVAILLLYAFLVRGCGRDAPRAARTASALALITSLWPRSC